MHISQKAQCLPSTLRALTASLGGACRPPILAAFAVLMAFAVIGGVSHAQNVNTGVLPNPTADPANRRVVVRFVTESDYPPFNFYDEDGILAGFNVDVARAICRELDTACDIKVKPWGELFLALKRGEADAVIAGHTVTPQALAQVDFTDRYFHTPGRFAARRAEKKIAMTPEGLEGKSIGVAKGTSHEAFVKTFFRSSAIKVFENAEQARDALLRDQIDFIFGDGISLAFWLHGTSSRLCCETRGGPYLEPMFFGDGIAIAVPKTDQQIKKLINDALTRLRENGRFEELVERYFPIKIY